MCYCSQFTALETMTLKAKNLAQGHKIAAIQSIRARIQPMPSESKPGDFIFLALVKIFNDHY